MVVATGGADLFPGPGPRGAHAVLALNAGDLRGVERIEHRLEGGAMPLAVRAVEAFEAVEHQDEPFDMPSVEQAVLHIERMRHRMGDAVFEDVVGNAINVV